MKRNKFSMFWDKGFFWIRIFEFGILIKNIKLHPLNFSERNGYIKGIKLGNYLIKRIKR